MAKFGRVLLFGVLSWSLELHNSDHLSDDLVVSDDWDFKISGSAYQVATVLSKKNSLTICSAVGDDDFSHLALGQLNQLGVDTTYIKQLAAYKNRLVISSSLDSKVTEPNRALALGVAKIDFSDDKYQTYYIASGLNDSYDLSEIAHQASLANATVVLQLNNPDALDLSKAKYVLEDVDLLITTAKVMEQLVPDWDQKSGYQNDSIKNLCRQATVVIGDQMVIAYSSTDIIKVTWEEDWRFDYDRFGAGFYQAYADKSDLSTAIYHGLVVNEFDLTTKIITESVI